MNLPIVTGLSVVVVKTMVAKDRTRQPLINMGDGSRLSEGEKEGGRERGRE